MNLLILSRKFEIFSTQRLVEEALIRGHHVSLWDPGKTANECSFNADAVLPRLGGYRFSEALSVLQTFESRGFKSFNNSQAYSHSRNKWNLYRRLQEWKLPTPSSQLLAKDANLLHNELSYPLIAKILESSQGEGVYLVSSLDELQAVRSNHPQEDLLIQEWISEAEGADVRAFVVGGKVVASMKRIAGEGEFRSNLHRGGHAETCALTAAEQDLALKLCQHLDLDIAGVDFLRSHRGSLILEANPCPGLEGIEKCTKINIAGEIIKFIEEHI
ncbi:Ribosomal protein S6 modification protein [compost metagenome]